MTSIILKDARRINWRNEKGLGIRCLRAPFLGILVIPVEGNVEK